MECFDSRPKASTPNRNAGQPSLAAREASGGGLPWYNPERMQSDGHQAGTLDGSHLEQEQYLTCGRAHHNVTLSRYQPQLSTSHALATQNLPLIG